jgi:hypothetical protein
MITLSLSNWILVIWNLWIKGKLLGLRSSHPRPIGKSSQSSLLSSLFSNHQWSPLRASLRLLVCIRRLWVTCSNSLKRGTQHSDPNTWPQLHRLQTLIDSIILIRSLLWAVLSLLCMGKLLLSPLPKNSSKHPLWVVMTIRGIMNILISKFHTEKWI